MPKYVSARLVVVTSFPALARERAALHLRGGRVRDERNVACVSARLESNDAIELYARVLVCFRMFYCSKSNQSDIQGELLQMIHAEKSWAWWVNHVGKRAVACASH